MTTLRDSIATVLHAHDCRINGVPDFPLSLTPQREATYLARADAVMVVVAEAMAAAVVEQAKRMPAPADYAWPEVY